MNTRTLVAVIVVVIIIIAGIAWYQKSAGAPGATYSNSQNTYTPSADQTSVSTQTASSSATTSEAMNSSSTSVKSSGGTTSVTTTVVSKEFTVTGANFSFSPSTLSVNKGDKVKITFKDESGTHTFNIDGYNVKTPLLAAGQQASVEFTATKTGTFEYYCSVATHRAMGMKGTLTVK
jgi:nitrite reductase (NO-forming)